MEKKSTAKLEEELRLFPDYTKFYKENRGQILYESLPKLLNALMEEKGLLRADVIRRTNLNEIYAYQIFQGKRMPDRKKILSLAFGMGLTFEETQTLLKSANYAPLYAKLPFDCIVIYGLMHQFSLSKMNDLLYDYGEDLIG